MLRELHISNLAIIDRLELELAPGLNVFTGQTGAGKSLILGAFELLLGGRAGGDLRRAGQDEARITGVFDLPDAALRSEIARLADLDKSRLEPGEPIIITRRILASGRATAHVSGAPVTTATLRAIGELLIDLHVGADAASRSASEAATLQRPAAQLDVLDAFAGPEAEADRRALADLVAKRRELIASREAASAGAALRREKLELYRFQAEEIDAVDPAPGEYEELQARYEVLSNLERVTRDATAVHGALYESEGAIVERLQAACAVLRTLEELDESLGEVVQAMSMATASLQDAAYTLGRYLSRLDLDPNELAEVTGRLNGLNRLIAKYGDGRLDDVIEFRARLAEQIDALDGAASDGRDLDERLAALDRAIAERAESLRTRRSAAAAEIAPLVERELRELAMPDAAFEIVLESLETANATGADRVEMMIRTNAGQPMRPIRAIASGGEMSRIMLALKSVFAGQERVNVLVFDEIDAKIGGRLGGVIGPKLRALANRHQVLCITHLPQVAAFADHHLRIEKRTERAETRASVSTLAAREERIAELAEMLAGRHVTKTTLAQAAELLDLAAASHAAPGAAMDAAASDATPPALPMVSVTRTGRTKRVRATG